MKQKIIIVWVKGGLYKKYIYFIMGWLDGENVCIIGKYDLSCLRLCVFFFWCVRKWFVLFCLVFYVCVFSLSLFCVWEFVCRECVGVTCFFLFFFCCFCFLLKTTTKKTLLDRVL